MPPVAVAVADAAAGLCVALLYGAATYCVGKAIVGDRARDLKPLEALVCLAVGAAAFSLLFSLLAVADLTPDWLVAIVPVAVLAIAGALQRRAAPGFIRGVPRLLAAFWFEQIDRPWLRIVFLALILYVAYVAAFALTPYRGADLAIYHLVVPRDVLRDGGWIYNPFFFAAGIPLGWHMFGLPAYALGGPSGYLALSLCCFVLTLFLAWRVSEFLFPDQPGIGAISALIVAYISVGHSQGSISNNDIGALFLELLAFAIAATAPAGSSLGLILGMICGFALATKATLLAGIALIFVIFLFRQTKRRAREALIFLLAFLPLAAIWPAVTLWHTGSPLPVFMGGPRLWGDPPLPQLTETTAIAAQLFGQWYRLNFSRLFTDGMIGLSLLLALLPVAIATAPRTSRHVALFLVAFATLQFLFLALLIGRSDLIFHDRYNTVCYVLLALASTWCLVPLARRAPSPLGEVALGSSLIALAATGLLWTGPIRNMGPNGSTIEEVSPALLTQLTTTVGTMIDGPEPAPDPLVAYIQRELPKSSIVATTMIAPYPLQHRFLQLLPLAQSKIDLRQSPAAIAEQLRGRNACFLHIPPTSGLNSWMDDVVQPWIAPLREICHSNQADMLLTMEGPPPYNGMLCRIQKC